MAQFKCRYMTDSRKTVEETIEADDRAALLKLLRSKGYYVIKVEEVTRGLGDIEIGSQHIKKADLTIFCRQLSTMLNSGIPMVKCFDVLASQSEDKVFKALMANLATDVSTGCSLSVAMSKYPDDFPDMLSEMVKVGEVTGDLNTVLVRMADQYERDGVITQKVKGALAYPIVVLIVAIVACVFMLIKVVPSFVDVFNSLNTDLPALTQALLDISDFITNKWYIALLAVPLIVLLLMRFFRIPKVKYQVDKLKLKLPALKGPLQKLVAARFARTLFTLVSSGVPIVQALDYTKRNVRNMYIEEDIDRIMIGIRQGKGLSMQMAECDAYPKLMTSMLSVGESSGDLEGMLEKCADYFDTETTFAIDQLMTIIEPVMIVLVGLLIGVLVLALYSPMFGAITAMQGAV